MRGRPSSPDTGASTPLVLRPVLGRESVAGRCWYDTLVRARSPRKGSRAWMTVASGALVPVPFASGMTRLTFPP